MTEILDVLITDNLLNILMIGITLSIIMMAVIQKIKGLTFITTDNQIWFINFILSFGIGIPFSIFFYELSIYEGIWISLFSFVGAPGIYLALKKQNMINYTPLSLDDKKDDVIEVKKENLIDRGEES
ncbi:MAG: hypothetical protein IJO32_07150 [Bacilli bacterium]|nr:hypothetical protein [Bacilli bacterium]